ncbi:MAG: hypothetical protein PF569_07555 [Candidatus Woesearchaeota archaeon]|jgi:hypothetical protein|nr:hypothetical protein [Candidatus Woesearchaeota archaeon]
MNDVEDNPNNPTILSGEKLNVRHHFIIKYKTEEDRIKFIEKVLKLIKDHEIRDYFIEEKKAFMKNRILYNHKTLINGNEFSFSQIDQEFCKYLN